MRPRSLLPPVLVLLLIGCHSEGKHVAGIDNFATVQDGPDGIYRGAQPKPEGFDTLRDRGVHTVINLRDDSVSDEQANAEKAGLTYVHIPTNAARIEPEKIRQFLAAMQTSPRPVFVHCAVGCDRTGLEVAMYRIVIEKWPRQQAIDELYAYGYHWAIYPGIARYLKTFPESDYAPAK